MNRTRLVPLIVATALFMENTDSTVIATSLPVIAESLNEDPVALKLAVTSYLVSLATRAGQRLDGRSLRLAHPVPGGARGVHGRLARLRRRRLARRLRRGALRPGDGRGHDGAGRPARAPAQHSEERDRRGA